MCFEFEHVAGGVTRPAGEQVEADSFGEAVGEDDQRTGAFGRASGQDGCSSEMLWCVDGGLACEAGLGGGDRLGVGVAGPECEAERVAAVLIDGP